MPDSCIAEDPGANSANLSIALNGAGVVLATVALAIERFRPFVRSSALAAILLGAPTIVLFFATGGVSSELACCVALTNSVGPVPAALLAAAASITLIVADKSGALVRCGCGGASGQPPPFERALFPPGLAWRARNAAVVATAAITVVFSGCVLGFYDPYLRTPKDASWDVTIGALLVSSALCGPLLVFLSAKELTYFVSGMEEKAPLSLEGSSEDAADAALRLLPLTHDGPSPAQAVFRHWLTRSLPSLLGNLIVFQGFLWLPVYGAEVASEHLGLGYSDASAVAWVSVGLFAVLALGGQRAWERRRQSGANGRCACV
jgi:hypothetical protein